MQDGDEGVDEGVEAKGTKVRGWMSKEFLAVCSSGKCWDLRYGVCEVSVREVRDQ